MFSEARIEATEEGPAPVGGGWFVLNAREARWRHRPGRGNSLPFTGWTDDECETHFPQVGIGLVVLEPSEPIGMYHWEADQEDVLVLVHQIATPVARRGAVIGLRRQNTAPTYHV